jgi:hypothetical protein
MLGLLACLATAVAPAGELRITISIELWQP